MSIHIKNITIADYRSPFFEKTTDVFIEHNVIKSVGENLSVKASTIIDGLHSKLYPGFIDVLSFVGEPGFENHEIINHAKSAASAGGYTQLFTSPFVNPIAENAASVLGIQQLFTHNNAPFTTMGCINKGASPKELSDMLDMHQLGVNLFTLNSEINIDDHILLNALQFIKAINGCLVIIPSTLALYPNAQMHEGNVSTGLGLAGSPSFAEQLILEKIVLFCNYTQAKIHVAGISSAESLPIIAKAKKDGLPITASTSPMHLLYNHIELENYDTNFKTNPPLRAETDRLALIEALQTGILDSVLSHHNPQHADQKDGEFDKASFGISSLETCFYMLTKAIPNATDEQICNWLSIHNATIANTLSSIFKEGSKADFVVIKKEPFLLKKELFKSKSKNNPLIGNSFEYKIIDF
jgi:dihydroorotase